MQANFCFRALFPVLGKSRNFWGNEDIFGEIKKILGK